MATSSSKGAYEGGVGGKFRKNQFRKQPTPYDRPGVFQAARQVIKSNLVDRASVLIARSAHSLFSSLFRKRLTAPPLVPEATRESRDEVQEANTISLGSGAHERVSNEPDNRSSGFGSNGINEIEEALKQKTFTKAEIDRLTELLRSRTVNVPAQNDKKRPDPTTSHTEAAYDFQGHANFPVQGNKMEIQRSFGGISAAAGNSSVLESDVAELAKAYMGSGPLNASPSNLGLRSPASRRDVPLLTNVPYTPKSSGVSLAPRFATGVSENGYTMPRLRGRSAIYNMARTPNSRVHDTATRKIDDHFTSSSSQWSLENNTISNGKQALKRRSSILDSDIGSVGPIRRIRQKTNMMSPPKKLTVSTSRSPFSISGNADGSDIARGSRSAMHKQMFLNGSKDNISNTRLAESDDNGIPNSVSVPPRSSEMAEKILQQLDKLMPSPKEKFSELKLAVAREKSPAKLTHNMLHGKALRSLEDIDSSKLLKDDTSDRLDGSQLVEARESTSDRQDKFDNGGRMLIAASNSKLAPKENGLETKASKEKALSVKTSDSAIFSFAVRSSEKKRAFRMSAHEDFLDVDDDSDNGEVGLTDEKEKPEKSAVDAEVITAKPGTSENHSIPSSESKSPTSSTFKEGADSKVNIASPIAEKDGGFTFPVTPASSTITQPTSPTTQAPLFSNGAAPPKEMTDAPILSFGSKSVDKPGPFKFSSKSPGVNESSNLTFGVQSEPKLTQSSIATVTATATDTPTVLKSNESDDSQKSRDLFGRPENFVPSAASTSATTNMFSSGLFPNSTKIKEEPFSVSSRLPISAAQVSNGSSDVIFSAATSTSTTVAATNTSTSSSPTDSTTTSSPSIAATTPTSSAASLFKFGSNSVTVPPNSSSGIESTHSELKDKMAPSFGFGASSSSGFTSMSSSIFGFGASTTSSTSNLSLSSSNQSLSSNPFGTAVGSPFGVQGASAETKPVSQPNPFGLSASSSTLGQSSSSSLSAGSSLFGSSSGFGLSSSTSLGANSGFGSSSSTSLGASSFTSSSGLFGSSLPSSTSSIFSSGFGSAASTPVFSFGATSAAAPSPAASTPNMFGSSLGSSSAPIFSFTPAATTTTSPSLPPSSSVFGTPSPVVQFGSTSQNNDQMSMEDSMAEDTIQASNSVVTAFGQPANSPPPGNFIFGSGAPSGGASPFQFGSQQSLGTPQNLSPFQGAANLEFSAGSSFSLGTGGVDKANRKIVRVKRDKLRKR